MIQLAMEVPTKLLPVMSRWADLDFALAHQVLEREDDAEFYRNRPNDRTLILDNSMHELGRALPVADLHRAAKLCDADYVIAPDELGKPEQNLEWYRDTQSVMGHEFKIAVVLAGRTKEERLEYLRTVKGADMLCLPFREPRFEWANEHPYRITAFQHVHLLGVSELDELRAWQTAASLYTKVRWSVDTAKPLKWAVQNEDLEDMYLSKVSLRGAKLSSKDLLNITSIPEDVLDQAKKNVDFLRTFLS